VNTPIGRKIDEDAIVVPVVTNTAERDENVTLEKLPTGVGRCGTRFYRLAALLGSHVVTVPLSVNSQCSRTGCDVVPEKAAYRKDTIKVEDQIHKPTIKSVYSRVLDDPISGFPRNAIGELVRNNDYLVVSLLVPVALLVHDYLYGCQSKAVEFIVNDF